MPDSCTSRFPPPPHQPTGLRVAGAANSTVTITHNLIRDTPYAGIMAGW